MPEAPVISTVTVASSDQGDEGSTSEGSSIEPGHEPGDTMTAPAARGRSRSTSTRFADSPAGGGAVLLSQLRRR